MPATLEDLIAHRAKSWHGINHPRSNFYQPEPEPVPEPQPNPPAPPAWFAEALAKLDALSARCDALIERNGVWTRYVTGGDNVA